MFLTDRHLHCVYFKYDNLNDINGECLLWKKRIERGYEMCCSRCVLKPSEVLTYFLKHEKYCSDWECASKQALVYMDKVGWMNNYPDTTHISK